MIVDVSNRQDEVTDRMVLIPIEIASLSILNNQVRLPGLSKEQLNQLPRYVKDNIDSNAEQTIKRVLKKTLPLIEKNVPIEKCIIQTAEISVYAKTIQEPIKRTN